GVVEGVGLEAAEVGPRVGIGADARAGGASGQHEQCEQGGQDTGEGVVRAHAASWRGGRLDGRIARAAVIMVGRTGPLQPWPGRNRTLGRVPAARREIAVVAWRLDPERDTWAHPDPPREDPPPPTPRSRRRRRSHCPATVATVDATLACKTSTRKSWRRTNRICGAGRS